MKPLIEVCIRNVTDETKTLFTEKLMNDVDYMEYDCTGNCEICFSKLYCLFEGELIFAETVEELEEKVKKEIEAFNL